MKRRFFPLFLLFIWILSGCAKQPEDFSSFSRHTFTEFLAGDTLSQAYILKDPSPYDLEKEKPAFGSYDPEILSENSGLIDLQKNTRKFLREESLTKEDLFTAELLDIWLSGQITGKLYYLYEDPFGTTSGLQTELPILLSEYPMDSKQDVENYLNLLQLTDDYLDSAMELEEEKAKAGLFMSDELLAICLEQIDTVINNSYQWLTEAFSRKLSEISLSKEEQVSYLTRQVTYLKEDFYPAFQELRKDLEDLKGSGKNTKGLCYFPQGEAYYEHLVENMVGTDQTPLQCKIRIQEEMISCFSHLSTIENQELSTKITEYSLFSVDYDHIVHALETAILQDFPAPPDTNCEIFEVPDSMSENVSPAFYLTARMDDPFHNVIYINPSEDTDYIHIFQTLAHEGFPGHLYQNVFFAGTNPDPLRAILCYTGYSEGWATYAEIYALKYLAKGDAELYNYLADSYSATLGIYSLCDIGIHYEGWDVEQLMNFLRVYFPGVEPATVKELYLQILGAPANYLNYYLGYLEIKDIWEDFHLQFPHVSEKEFYDKFLSLGPAPFPLLRKTLLSAE